MSTPIILSRREHGPTVVAVAPGSPAAIAGVRPGDEITAVNGRAPRDVIEWQWAIDGPEIEVSLRRDGLDFDLEISRPVDVPLGVEVHSAVFDRVRTCDNHCEFCFIHQLPTGMRRSLYLKDDDYRLSFLYGNFTTLTRFTEADLERVVTERLSPLHVSIHATEAEARVRMLRNRRGAMSLRWLRAMLDHGIEVRGQIVVCPGVNDGAVLEQTLTGIADRFPDLASVAVVPLGVSAFNTEAAMRPHTVDEARAVLRTVHSWQAIMLDLVGRRLVHAADEYYLTAGMDLPPLEDYEGCPMHEDGIGMARTFAAEFAGLTDAATGVRRGFFAAVDTRSTPGARPMDPLPTNPAAYTGLRATPVGLGPTRSRRDVDETVVLTGELGALVVGPLIAGLGRSDVRVVAVENRFFGGNTGVTGLMTGQDLRRVLSGEPENARFLLPDVCLSDDGLLLDGVRVDDLGRRVEVIPTDGRALRRALEASDGPH
jgi:putative radical SAM enzyme (TIGR03279 family)